MRVRSERWTEEVEESLKTYRSLQYVTETTVETTSGRYPTHTSAAFGRPPLIDVGDTEGQTIPEARRVGITARS